MDVAEFVRGLRSVKVWAGDPSLETLRRHTGVATSTLSDAFNPQRRRLPSLELVRAVLRACGADPRQSAAWEVAWRAVRAGAAEREPRPEAVATPRGDSSPLIPRQLPSDTAGFAGRSAAIAELAAGWPDAPATVVTGTAGVGKTALAVHWAHRVAAAFPDGQLYLDLRGHAEGPTLSAHEALSVLLKSLGVPGERIPVEVELQIGLYRSVLADRRVLIVLDNAPDAAHVRPLLPGSALCRVLVTSRDALTGLVVRDGAVRIALDTLPEPESAALLAAHLGPARVAAEPEAAAELAALCANLPLALRIAAANLAARPAQTITGLVGELSSADLLSQLLVVGDPESAVEAAFDLSYRRLSPVARRLFRLLGLVPGPEAGRPAAAVLLERPSTAAVPELDELLAAHLLSEYRPGRYRMHDLLSLFARRRAQREDGPQECEAALHRLLSWYVLTVDAATYHFLPGYQREDRAELAMVGAAHPISGAEEARAWLDVELGCLTAGVHHAAEHGPAAFSWQLTHALRGFLHTRRLDVDFLAVGQASLRAARAADSDFGQAISHAALGMARIATGSLDLATRHTRLSFELFEAIGHHRGMGSAANNLSDEALRAGKLNEARAWAARAVTLIAEHPMADNDFIPTITMGQLQALSGDYDTALPILDDAARSSAHFGGTNLTAIINVIRGLARLFLGDSDLAEELLLAGRAAAERGGSEANLYDCLAALLLVHVRSERPTTTAIETAVLLEELMRTGTHCHSADDWAHAALLELHLAVSPPEQALAYGEAALALHLEADHRLVVMRLRTRLGHGYAGTGAFDEATAHWQAALAYATEEDLPDRHVLEWLLATAPGDPSDRP